MRYCFRIMLLALERNFIMSTPLDQALAEFDRSPSFMTAISFSTALMNDSYYLVTDPQILRKRLASSRLHLNGKTEMPQPETPDEARKSHSIRIWTHQATSDPFMRFYPVNLFDLVELTKLAQDDVFHDVEVFTFVTPTDEYTFSLDTMITLCAADFKKFES